MTNLKTIRQSCGLSQTQLAEAAGLSLRTLQEYEQGRKNINGAAVTTVMRLAEALSCQIADLIESE